MSFKRLLTLLFVSVLMLSGCSTHQTTQEKVNEETHFALLTGMKAAKLNKIKRDYTDLIVNGSFTKEELTHAKKKTKVLYGQFDLSASTTDDEAFTQKVKLMKDNGYNGLYLTGIDKLYEKKNYPTVIHLLNSARQLHMTLIVKDGDRFINEYIKRKGDKKLIKGVLKENVYTKYNKKDRTLGQSKKVSDARKDFLDKVVRYGLQAYVVEYTKASDWKAAIAHDASKRHYNYIIVKQHKLNKEE